MAMAIRHILTVMRTRATPTAIRHMIMRIGPTATAIRTTVMLIRGTAIRPTAIPHGTIAGRTAVFAGITATALFGIRGFAEALPLSWR